MIMNNMASPIKLTNYLGKLVDYFRRGHTKCPCSDGLHTEGCLLYEEAFEFYDIATRETSGLPAWKNLKGEDVHLLRGELLTFIEKVIKYFRPHYHKCWFHGCGSECLLFREATQWYANLLEGTPLKQLAEGSHSCD